jgi:hypothetical protein
MAPPMSRPPLPASRREQDNYAEVSMHFESSPSYLLFGSSWRDERWWPWERELEWEFLSRCRCLDLDLP